MDKLEQLSHMHDLINKLNKAIVDYYINNSPSISDRQYDILYDQLVALEKETGVIVANSPTQKVGAIVMDSLPKVKHSESMLSLDKTKSIDELVAWLGDEEGLLGWKKDGLTVVVNYDEGKLLKAVTRGDGDIGEDITHNARVFVNLPLIIPYKGKLEVRGEAVISGKEFDRINELRIANGEEPFKTPRNLASGSVRQLDNSIAKERHVMFFAFGLISSDLAPFYFKDLQYNWLETLGFYTVRAFIVNKNNLAKTVETLDPKLCDYPTDGLVLTYNSVKYSNSLGTTSHHPLHSIAFKWCDDVYETDYSHTECEIGRTGVATPTAVFKTVEIDGTAVSRASCHNIDVWEDLKLGKGDKITIYKANQIIPQIDDNLTRSGTDKLPTHCSSCGSEFIIYQPKKARFLMCVNSDCPAKFLNKLAYFASRECMNITGLSKETLEKFIVSGLITEYADIYTLEQHKQTIVNMQGFGLSSYNKIITGINNSRKVELPSLINALGIKLVGLSTAKLIVKAFDGNVKLIFGATYNSLINIKGIGAETALSFEQYFLDSNNRDMFKRLWEQIEIIKSAETISGQSLTGLVFVITGDVVQFKNRKELQTKIESLGGAVSGSVSKNTNYVIANEISNSSKFTTAQKLNIPVISELEFIAMMNKN